MSVTTGRALALTLLAATWSTTAATAGAEPNASAWVQGHNSRMRLIGDGNFVAGVEIELQPDWKTYWRMPGDSGVPPNFDWSGSENLEQATVGYPAPARLIDKSGTAIGYKNSVVFLLPLQPKDRSRPIRLVLSMEYGICRDICIPLEAKLALDLPPDAGIKNATITETMARVPRAVSARLPTDPEIVNVSATLNGAAPAVTVAARNATDVFVEAPDGLFMPLTTLPPAVDTATGASIFTVDLTKSPDAKDLAGKPLRITVVNPKGAIETTWTAP